MQQAPQWDRPMTMALGDGGAVCVINNARQCQLLTCCPANMRISCKSGAQASKQLPEGGINTCSCFWCCFYLQSQAWRSCAYG